MVGLCTAYYLAERGLPVEIVERRGWAPACSRGNAGWVCLSHSTPVPAPGVLRYAVRSLGRPGLAALSAPAAGPRVRTVAVAVLAQQHARGVPARLRGDRRAEPHHASTSSTGCAEAGVETTLSRPGMVHAFLSPGEARHHLAAPAADGGRPLPAPDDVSTGAEARPWTARWRRRSRGRLPRPRRRRGRPGGLRPGARRTAGGDRGEGPRERGGAPASGATGGDRVTAVVTDTGEIPLLGRRDRGRSALRGPAARAGTPAAAPGGQGLQLLRRPRPRTRRTRCTSATSRAVASPIGGTTRIAGTMELSGNNNRLDWRRIVAVARASRHYLGQWFDDPGRPGGLIRDPWVGGRPFLPDGLPVIDRVPGTRQRLRRHRARHARRHAWARSPASDSPRTSSPAAAPPPSPVPPRPAPRLTAR